MHYYFSHCHQIKIQGRFGYSLVPGNALDAAGEIHLLFDDLLNEYQHLYDDEGFVYQLPSRITIEKIDRDELGNSQWLIHPADDNDESYIVLTRFYSLSTDEMWIDEIESTGKILDSIYLERHGRRSIAFIAILEPNQYIVSNPNELQNRHIAIYEPNVPEGISPLTINMVSKHGYEMQKNGSRGLEFQTEYPV